MTTWASGYPWAASGMSWLGTWPAALASDPGVVNPTGLGVKVEIAFSTAPDSLTPDWVDVTDDVLETGGLGYSRGRLDEFSSVEPGTLTLVLDNSSGDYTFGNAAGAHYPNVQPGKRLRVSLSVDDGGSWHPRFDGHVNGWPTVFAAGLTDHPWIQIQAVDRLSRLSSTRLLRDALHEELGTAAEDQTKGWVLDDPDYSVLGDTTVLAGGVVWLYGLQEGSGSTTAGDVSGAAGRPMLTATQVGADGSLTFGSSGIMPEGTAVQFSPASAGNGLVLYSADAGAYLATEFSLWCQFSWTAGTGVTLVTMGTGAPKVVLTATSSTVVATFTGAEGATATATKSIATGDNAPHFALVTVSGTTISLYVDEETAATGTVPTGMGYATGLTVGGTSSADEHQVAWVGYANAATSATRAGELGMLGSGGSEASDARVGRILRWLDLDGDAEMETGLSDVAYQATGGAQGLDLIAAVHDVEGGVLAPTGDGRFLNQSRSHRYNTEPVLSLDASDVAPDLLVQVDLATTVNSLSVSRPKGATFLVRDEASIATFGRLSSDMTIYAASDDDLRAAAEWRVSRYSTPMPRVPSITVNMFRNASIAAAVLSLEVGDRIQVTGLPATGTPGGATLDLFVEGFEEQVSSSAWTTRIATSPALDLGYVWVLDDATYSVLDSTTVLAY